MQEFILIADLEAILKTLLPIVIFIVWVISQIMGGRENANAGKPKVRPKPQPDGPQPERGLREEIESFLKDAANRRGDDRDRPAVQAVAVETPLDIEVIEEPAQRRLAAAMPSAAKEGINTREFQERASHLGEEVGLADEKLAEHLHQVFDHKLGRLGGLGDPLQGPPPVHKSEIDPHEKSDRERDHPETRIPKDAARIAALLRKPQGARQAIIMNEILRRPADEW